MTDSAEKTMCGLCCVEPSQPAPVLEGVIVHATLNTNRTCKVQLLQSYHNPADQAVEVSYMFPLDHRAAVCAFEATIAGTTIEGKVMPTKKAQETYQQAKKEGRKASLLTQDKQEIFQVHLGNVPAGTRATIQLTYVSELLHRSDVTTQQKGTIHFFLPTHVAPRYCPTGSSSSSPWWCDVPICLLSLVQRRGVSTSEALSPLSVFVDISSHCPFQEITSSSHGITVEKIPGSSTPYQAQVSFLSNSALDRDFLLDVVVDQPHQPMTTLEIDPTNPTSAVASVFFVPQFNLKNDPSHMNFVFVVDRSGSMQGNKMADTSKTLQLFLKALPSGCHFNIVGFGSDFQFLFNESVPYNDDTMAKAVAHAEMMQADLGGTEILKPLEEIFKRDAGSKKDKQIFVLTDGEVGNTESVISCVATHCHKTNDRVFTIGVGSDVSHQLVDGMAAAGKGTAVYATGQGDKLAGEVQRQLKQALQPYLRKVEISWPQPTPVPCDNTSEPMTDSDTSGSVSSTMTKMIKGAVNSFGSLMGHVSADASGLPEIKELPPAPVPLVREVPHLMPSLHSGCQFLVYAMFNGQMPSTLPSTLTIKAETPSEGPLTLSVPLMCTRDTLMHVLAARRRIKELEEQTSDHQFGLYRSNDATSASDKEIETLAMKWGLMSRCTSYVAYEGAPISVPEEKIHHIRAMGMSKGGGGSMKKSLCFSLSSAPPSSSRGMVLECFSSRADSFECADMDMESGRREKSDRSRSRPSKPARDDLMIILGCVKSSGEIVWSSQMDSIQVLASAKSKGNPTNAIPENVWLNALIMAYCEKHFADRRDEWELIFDKVKTWMCSQIPEPQMMTLMQQASMIV